MFFSKLQQFFVQDANVTCFTVICECLLRASNSKRTKVQHLSRFLRGSVLRYRNRNASFSDQRRSQNAETSAVKCSAEIV